MLSFILTLFAVSLFAQTEPCGFKEAMEMMFQEEVDYQNQISSFNTQLLQNPSQGQMQTDEYEIPIVVHVIHNSGVENISDAQIYEAVSQANSQFAGEEGGFDTKIKLTFASIDPLGNCTNGINRVTSSFTNVQSISYYDDVALKNLSRWNPSQYLNIWIVRSLPGNVAGYAYFPSNSSTLPNVDGVVISHEYFGTTGTAAGNSLNTLSHEVGHYLSLYHVWGVDWAAAGAHCDLKCDLDEPCTENGDRVCDTNPCLNANFTSNCDPHPSDCESCPDFPQGLFTYPKENYMSYAHSCQDRFTQGQAERMYFALNQYRSELWSTDNRICTGLNTISGDLHIWENDTWTTVNLYNDGDITITGNLTIEPGATLTIDPGVTVRFCGNGKLVIKPNARLNLSGTLTNSCGEPWKGVEVWGDNSQSQYSVGGVRAQGRFTGRNGSVIENARTGVQLWGPDYYNDAGGQISCSGTTFRNNKVAVEFAPYENFWPYPWPSGWQGQPRSYAGSFSNCTFVTNDDYINSEPFHSFLHMTGINGVRITGSSFTMNQTLTDCDNVSNYGYGIFATDAGFQVRARCTSTTYPCNNYVHSSFEGLGYGIYTANIIGNKPYIVRQTDFSDCFVGLYNSAVSSGTMLFNDFYLGNVPNPSITSEQLGVVFENHISGFTFEENDFIGTGGNVSLTVGTLSKNIGFFNNKVRRNNYSNLSIGNLSNGENATSSFYDRGLHYLCNDNSNSTQFDFVVPNEPGIDRIRPSQGLEYEDEITGDILYDAAGNSFSYTSTDVENQGSPVDYYYYPLGTNETPMTFAGSFTAISASENTCPETYCEPPCKTQAEVAQEKDKYYDDRTKEEQAKTERDAAINNGDTELAEQKEREAEYHKQRMDKEAFMVVLHLMHDTLLFDQDTLAVWIENLDAFGADMIFALSQQTDGNPTIAQQALSRAADRTDLSPTQHADLADMRRLMTVLERKSPYALSEKDLKVLERLATRDESFTGNISRNILSLYGRHFPINFRLPKGKIAELRTTPDTAASKTESEISVYPNPASKVVSLLWQPRKNDMESGELILRDVSGRVLQRVKIQAHQNMQISLLDMPSGVVFYQLQTTAGIVETGKLIIQ